MNTCLFFGLFFFFLLPLAMPMETFEEIKNKYTLQKMAPIFQIKANKTPKLSQELIKIRIQREFFLQFNVCYKRFQLCSSHLSPEFCAAPEMHLSFFFWARTLAKDIMGGAYDGYPNVKCSPVLVTDILLRIQNKADQRDKVLAMVQNSMAPA